MSESENSWAARPVHGALLSFSRSHPQAAAWIAALALSLIWTGVWLMVFLILTMLMDLETSVLILLLSLWLGIVAEAPIRYVENTDFVAVMSKVHESDPKGDNQDYKATRATAYTALGIAPMVVFLIWWFLSGEDINQIKSTLGTIFGPSPERGWEHSLAMFGSWIEAGGQPVVWQVAAGCVFMRALIYKRKVHPRNG